MNNGKVRIYELSKELNLDNKDLLTICEGLNISVKSHSSTISEAEAERIRAAAEKYSNRSTTAKRVNTGERTERRLPGSPAIKLGERPNAEHKQQILQIKHKLGSGSSSKDSGANVAIPPQPPVKPQTASPMKPTLHRPVRQSELEADVTPQETTLEGENLQDSESPQPLVSVDSRPTKPPVSTEPKISSVQPAPLVEPPVRPSAPSSGDSPRNLSLQLPTVERPVLKKAKVESAPAEVNRSQPPTPTRPVGNRRPAPPTEQSEAPAQPIPELQRPQRKAKPQVRELPRPGVGAKSGDGPRMPNRSSGLSESKDNNDDSSIETLELDLKRPTPPRLVKKGKTWEEDTEE